MNLLTKFKYEILIFLFFVLSRVPNLGHDTFNTDVFKWKVRSYDFSSAIFSLNFANTIQKYHPGVTLMWLGTFGIKVANLIADYHVELDTLQRLFLLHFYQKLFVVLTIGITLSFCYSALKRIMDFNIALAIIFFISLEPFYIALTREFHLEGMLSTFMLSSILWLYVFLTNSSSTKSLFISAVFAGLSILTKTSAVFLILFSGLNLVILSWSSRSRKIQTLNFIKWLVGLIVIVFILWPALWVTSTHVFQELTRGVVEVGVDADHIQFYFGKLVGDPGLSYYPVVFALRSSIVLFFGVLGYLFIFNKLSEDQKKFSKYMMLFCFFYLIQLTIPSKKLDRYLLPVFVVLPIFATYFYSYIASKLNFKKLYLVGVLSLILISTAIYVHYDYFSFYNPLFGGLKTGINVIEPKWIIGEPEIISYFKRIKQEKGFIDSGQDQSLEEVIYRDHNENVLTVGFQEKYYTQIWPFFREINSWAVIQDITVFAQNSKYFVYPVWDDRGPSEDRFKVKLIAEIKIRGVVVYRVYEKIS